MGIDALAKEKDQKQHDKRPTQSLEQPDASRLTSPSSQSFNGLILNAVGGSFPLLEVKYNGVTRSLLVDTGSADIWMTVADYQCLNASGFPIPRTRCNYNDPYLSAPILQTGIET